MSFHKIAIFSINYALGNKILNFTIIHSGYKLPAFENVRVTLLAKKKILPEYLYACHLLKPVTANRWFRSYVTWKVVVK